MVLSKIKDAFTGFGADAVLSAGLAFTQANNVKAEETTAHATPRVIDTMDLRFGDLRGEGYGVGRTVAVGGSAEFAVFKLHSNDPETIAQVHEDLRRMMMVGYSKLGLIVADGKDGYDESAELYILATEGKPSARIHNIDAPNSSIEIMRVLEDNYPLVWKQPSLAALNTPSATQE